MKSKKEQVYEIVYYIMKELGYEQLFLQYRGVIWSALTEKKAEKVIQVLRGICTRLNSQ